MKAVWLNEWEVEQVREAYQADPILRPATMTLASLVRWTNENSDGWPYWKKPARAAEKLMVLIEAAHSPSLGDPVVPTEAAYKAALVPIKAFRTRQGAEFPIYEITPVAVRLEELRVELRAERISYGELAELQGLADQIGPGDVELLEAAGVPEFPEPEGISEQTRAEVKAALEGDSNDAEHDALVSVAGELGISWVAFDDGDDDA